VVRHEVQNNLNFFCFHSDDPFNRFIDFIELFLVLLSTLQSTSAETFSCKFVKLQPTGSTLSCELFNVFFMQRKLFNLEVNKTAIETLIDVDEDYFEDETCNDVVKELKFKSSKLTTIPVKVFEVFSQLEVFNAADTELKILLPRTFEKAENLQAIYLQNNRISKIENEIFNYVRTLKILDLSNNQIVKIHAKDLAKLESLEDLNLSNNRLSELDDDIFANLRSLKSIGLESNELTMIASNLFTKVHINLATISMNFNQIDEISPNVFDTLENLRFLFLSGNKCVDRSFTNHVIPDNVSIKMELAECFKKFRKIFLMSDGKFNITKDLVQVGKSQEVCDYEFGSLKKALEEMERQLEKV
jgi:hypothetical protein